MTLFLLSLVGIPPLAGFAGKFLLFGAAMDAGFTWLALLAVVNSVLALAAYLRIIVPMYKPPAAHNKSFSHLDASPHLITLVWSVSVIVTLGLGIAGQWVLGAIQ